MKDRIAQIIREEQMTAILFARETGIQQASLSHILKGRNNPSLDIIKKIHQRFPHVNLDWLLYGEGNMYVDGYLPKESEMSENDINPSDSLDFSEYRKEIELKEGQSEVKETVKEVVKYVERPPKKIVEIRIFFDDGTFETLIPQK